MAERHTFIARNHDELARDGFVLNLKWHINLDLAPGLRDVYEKRARPAFRKAAGRDFDTRHEVRKQMLKEDFFQAWGSLWNTAQELMWDSATSQVDKRIDGLNAKAKREAARMGSLRLNPKFKHPGYAVDVDIHGQPGGYGYDAGGDDVTAGAIYDAGTKLYGIGQGLPRGDSPARALLNFVKKRYPNLKPKRILEEGCSIGSSTPMIREAFPDAEIYAIDIGAGLLRYAHGRLSEQGIPVHFSQQNAEETDFPDGHFDLIVSNIMLHETSHKAMPRIMKECHRLLKPGGVMAHMDVPLRNSKLELYMQWYRDWSTHFNNEPFWGGLHDMDVVEPIVRGGFARAKAFDEFFPNTTGTGVWWACGAQK
jgi:ubiquinone/menaquinone biosynthesis C-methylase UbiE